MKFDELRIKRQLQLVSYTIITKRINFSLVRQMSEYFIFYGDNNYLSNEVAAENSLS